MISKGFQDHSNVIFKIMLTTGVDKDVIYECYETYIEILLEQSIYDVHKICWGIG